MAGAKLPYFKWYASDAEADDFYASLSQEERGVYHTLLNRSWINNGIPKDPELLARICRMTRARFLKAWARIEQKFQSSPHDSQKLFNERLERERAEINAKSIANQRKGNANASHSRLKRVTTRAYGSGSGSGSGVVQGGAGGNSEISRPKAVVVLPPEGSFNLWWELWSGKRGTAHQDRAAHAWISEVTAVNLAAAMECTASYLASGKCDDGHGWNPDNFLFEMSKTQFSARWPAKAKRPGSESLADRTIELVRSRIAKGERPL